MTLRARLLLSVAGLLAVSLIVGGAALVQITRANLIEQVDRELTGGGRGPGVFRPGRGGPDATDPTGRRAAFLLLDSLGAVIESIPSGFAAEPDPLPDLTGWFAIDGSDPRVQRALFTASSEDGNVDFRVIVARGPADTWAALAAPLNGVRQTVADLVRTLVLVGIIALAAVVAVGWVLIRRDLRPIEEMARATSRIAEGDLDHRVVHPPDGSEVGRLGAAFNVMLDRISDAFGAQRASLVEKEASEARLRRFVADASHELRTPLTSVRGYAELYRAGGLTDPADLERAMGRIETESTRMGRLVEDLLLLARLDEGRPLRLAPMDLSAIVADAVADARALDPDRPISVDIAESIVVRGDEDRVRQVVGNLLGNVRVHTPSGTPGEIVVQEIDDTDVDGARVAVLRVVDHGPGIPPDHIDRVFDRLYRADQARTRDRGGSGLGLAIVAAIVDAHGGSIAAEPTPGGGATFTVRIPIG